MTEIVPLANVIQLPEDSQDMCRLRSFQGGAISIGNFDGVHRGHANLLGEVRRLADQIGGPAVAVALDPHPAVILRPDKAPGRLTWIERRAELMTPLGIDALVVCQTSAEFLQLPAAEFYQAVVGDCLAARAIVEGPNFYFGRGRGGDITMLGELCRRGNVELRIAEPTSIDGEMISSTRIRQLLQQGRVEQARELLGGPYRLRGAVIAGAKRGRTIGFPTANLGNIDVVVPAPGVYGGIAWAGGQRCEAAIHIGPNPTFEKDGAVKVEVHLLDYDGDLYDQPLLVDFITHVRDIARFASADILVEQLDRDVRTIRSRLAQFRNSRT